ncbi:ABC transporter transmembrane domain-containing protein [Paenibacillus sp. 1P07SE]|uniref:ABC transporter transmembrane domain-containing protein n=1 Tax=Paenibacillus sp. 1P07SE TaxID=3132209 RepID=UPI0039A75BAF
MIRRYMLPHKWMCGFFVLAILVEAGYAVAAPLSLKFLVDQAFEPRDLQMFWTILLVLLAGGLLSLGAGALGEYTLGHVSGRAVRSMRDELFAHIQKQSLPFYSKYRVGDLVTRFSADMGSIERVIRGTAPMLLSQSLSVLLGLSLLFMLEWRLTLLMLAGSTLMFILPRLVQRRAEEANSTYKEAQERFSNTIDEMVKGHKTIKGLHQQRRFGLLAGSQISDLFRFGLRLHMTSSLMERLPVAALLLLNGIMIGVGGWLIFQETISVGDFIAFFTLFMTVGQSGSSLAYLIPALIESGVSIRRIGEVLQHQPDVPEHPQATQAGMTFRTLTLEGVSFGYTPETTQLEEVSLRVDAGSYVALVGPSGSGKSTALQLLSRFYDPRQGQVLLDGVDLRQISESAFRRLAVLVTQDTFLFNTTIRDNLMLDREVEEAEMIAAAKAARVHDAIMRRPEGYDTLVEQEGGSLSGGERQRLALARALLRRPSLLLLDEVTSALDPVSEADINRLLEQIRGEHTIITVTHRLASVVRADIIHVFCEGRIAESGTHDELLQRRGLYAELWDKQHGFQVSADGRSARVDGERLARLPFFAGIDAELLVDVAGQFESQTCADGESVVVEGEEGDTFYIIVRGRFEVLKRTGEGDKRVAVLQDGDHFGEIALLRGIPRTATVRAMGPATLLSMRRETFDGLTTAHPQLRLALERSLQERMS